jgi:prolyl-tRNA synthetase
MRWSKLFIPTLRENPADADTIAQKLLVRAGYARAVSTGVYGWLPLGQRSLEKLRRMARGYLEAIGGQEVELTESAAAAIAQGELRSPKQLPQIWFRFESGPMRARQMMGLEVFSFGAERAVFDAALRNVVEGCGLPFRQAEDAIFVLHESGADTAVTCAACDYIASPRTAAGRPTAPPPDPEGDLAPEPFHTPGQKTIADLARFTGLPESAQMKSLVLVAGGKPVLVMLRGDHQLSQAKFAAKTGDTKFRQATGEELFTWFGAKAGSLGPVGVTNMPILADTALSGRRNMVCGANRDDYHLRHVTPGEDFAAEFCNLREVMAGDECACGARLDFRAATEIARHSDVVNRLSFERILHTAVELGNDKDGMILPPMIAPFDVVVTAAIVSDASEGVYSDCITAGLATLYDDRDERAGVKFKDADLIGAPLRINVGRKMAEGLVEVVDRKTKQVVDVPVGQTIDFCRLSLGRR